MKTLFLICVAAALLSVTALVFAGAPCHGIMSLSRDGGDVEVNVSSLNCEIVGAQFFFDFDPECWTASGITPGDGWTEAFEAIDNEAGTIEYAVVRFDGVDDDHVVATIDFDGDSGCCLTFDDAHVPGTKLATSEPPYQITPPQLRLIPFFCDP